MGKQDHIKLFRYCDHYQAQLDKIKRQLINKSTLSKRTKSHLHKVPGFVCDRAFGFAEINPWHIIVPLFSTNKSRGKDYFTYYIAHELSHLADYYHKCEGRHGKEFYKMFVKICPRNLQYHEWKYKPNQCNKFNIPKK